MQRPGNGPGHKEGTNLMTIKIGDRVAYVDSKKHTKLAIVTGTPETIADDSRLDTLQEGFLHLAVLVPGSSHVQPRLSVPSEVALKELLVDAEQTLAKYDAEHPEGPDPEAVDESVTGDYDDEDDSDDDEDEGVDESADYKARAVLSAHRSKDDGAPIRFWTAI